MCFHLDRCDILSVTKSKRKHYHALHGQMLKPVNSTHFLGVTLTSDTTWETYQHHLKSKQKAAWWTPQRCCRISNVTNMLTTLGWPYLQHRCRKARLVNTRWLSQYHKSPSFPFPVIPSAYLSSVVLTTGSSPFSPTQSRIEMTSLRMWLLHPPLRLFVHVFQNQYLWSRPCPPGKYSVDDG